ncbi:MAG: DMT family transporter [Mangrovicoccus sp.]
MTKDRMIRAKAALVLACLLWSGNFVVGRAMRGEIDPASLNALRWSLALIVFAPLAMGSFRKKWRLAMFHWRLILAMAATGVVGFQFALYTALRTTPVANSVLLLAVTPLLIVASSALLGKGSLTPRRIAALALSLLGVATLLGNGDPRAVLAFDLGQGDLWLLGAVTCWTIYTQLLRATPKELPGDVTLFASMLVGVPLLWSLWLISPTVPMAQFPAQVWIGILYVGLGAALLAFIAWGYGVKGVGPDSAGLFLNLMPVFSIALAFIFLGEGIGWGQLSGAALILAALILGGRGK